MIYDHDTDTGPPHNIFDEEFGKDTKVLPPSRPISEPTPIAYQIAKTRINLEFGRILQAVTRVGQHVTYDEILLRDRKLREVMDDLPPHLKMQPLEGSHDPAKLIIARLNVNILYNKIMCILHRKHLVLARQNPRYAPSRRSAIEASLETLRHFRDVFREMPTQWPPSPDEMVRPGDIEGHPTTDNAGGTRSTPRDTSQELGAISEFAGGVLLDTRAAARNDRGPRDST